jgi:hypothetical protein
MTRATGDSRRRAAAAVDIGGTKVAAAVVTSDGLIIDASHRPSRGVAAQEITALLAEDLRAAIATAQADGFTVESLGIGATGRHDLATGRLGAIDAVLDGWGGSSLPRDLASKLAVQTVAGAAEMASETMMHPALLREMVTSPGGTTIAGLAELERGGLRSAVMDAVRAAALRSAELGGSDAED